MQWLINILEWLTKFRPSALEQEVTILMILTHGREMYGLDIQRAAPDILSENSIYVRLTHLVSVGFVTSRLETNAEKKTRGPRRRLYKITDVGRGRWTEFEQTNLAPARDEGLQTT